MHPGLPGATARPPGFAEQAYRLLQEKAGRAENEGDTAQATEIRKCLKDIDSHAEEQLLELCDKHGLVWPSSIQGPPRTTPAALPRWGWCEAHRKLRGIRDHFKQAGELQTARQFDIAAKRMKSRVDYYFGVHPTNEEELLPARRGFSVIPGLPTRPEQKYRVLEAMAGQVETASGAGMLPGICQSMKSVNEAARKVLNDLTRDYGQLEELAAKTGLTEWQAPATAGPGATHATVQATVAPPLLHMNPMPVPGFVSADTRPRTAGAAALPSMAQLLSAPPGPSSRVMPAEAASTAMAPGSEVPLAQRRAIAERFSSDVAVLDAGFALGSGATETLGWDATRADRVLVDLHRLSSYAAMDPATAAALHDIDWSGIEALLGVMESPPASRSPSPAPGV